MKKFLILLVVMVLPLAAYAQAQINTKKVKISDFPEKVTKVVLTGNVLFDAILQEEIAARWRIAPYEFCTLKEFNELKAKDKYYFLITTKGQFKSESEPGLQFLTLVQGGAKGADGINNMLEIVSLPIGSANNPNGRELVFLPAFITIIQQYTLDSMEHDLKAYLGLSTYTKELPYTSSMNILFAEEDLNPEISDETQKTYKNKGIVVTTSDEANNMLEKAAPNTLVSYVAAPSDPKNGSLCYKMLIDTQTYRLCFFRRHRINPKYGVGFTEYDIRSISHTRKSIKK